MDINDLTYKINGAVFEVNKILGPGFLEKVYENALMYELKLRGLRVQNQVPLKVQYKEIYAGDYIADLLVEDSVLLEIKSVKSLSKEHEAQLINYLKILNIEVGLLINFTYPKADIKRFRN